MSDLNRFLEMSPANMSSGHLATAIRQIESEEVSIETNEGTFGATDCQRATGSGDPRYGNYSKIMRISDGSIRTIGCEPEKAPGYARYSDIGRRLYRKLNEMRRELRQRQN